MFLTAANAVLYPLFSTLLVSFVSCILVLLYVCVVIYKIVGSPISGDLQGEIPMRMHIHGRIYTAFLCSWSNYQSTTNATFHDWDVNKAEWGKCFFTDESSWSKYNAPQFLSSFFYCAGIGAFRALFLCIYSLILVHACVLLCVIYISMFCLFSSS